MTPWRAATVTTASTSAAEERESVEVSSAVAVVADVMEVELAPLTG